MSKTGEPRGPGELVNRNQIARLIFNAAASMGISDREAVEKLTSQVIERLERPRVLPGMEDLVPKAAKQPIPLASDADILSMVKEFLAVEKPAVAEEKAQPKTDTQILHAAESPTQPKVKPGARPAKETQAMPTKSKTTAPSTSLELSENALRVLEKHILRRTRPARSSRHPRRCSAAWPRS